MHCLLTEVVVHIMVGTVWFFPVMSTTQLWPRKTRFLRIRILFLLLHFLVFIPFLVLFSIDFIHYIITITPCTSTTTNRASFPPRFRPPAACHDLLFVLNLVLGARFRSRARFSSPNPSRIRLAPRESSRNPPSPPALTLIPSHPFVLESL